MNKLNLIICTFVLSLCTLGGVAQSTGVPSGITDALKKGDATGLSAFFNDNVELVIDNKNDIFSRQQASGIVSDFFRRNKATGFSVLHKGEKESAGFLIGTLKAGNNSFRVYILTRQNGNKEVIQQLRIEPTNE